MAFALPSTACGQAFSSPAAVVNGTRISVGDVREEVALNLSELQLQAQSEEEEKDLNRRVLGFLIDLEVIRQYASEHGIVVTERDLQETLQALIQQAGGREAFDQFLSDRGLTAEDARTVAGRQALFEHTRHYLAVSGEAERILAEQGVVAGTPSDAEIDQAFQLWLERELGGAGITVNPRFGRFDLATGTVVPLTSTGG
jgi:SurA-like N-terminal domain